MHTEYLSAGELHVVFKQIIKGKVKGHLEVIPGDTAQNVYITPGQSNLVGGTVAHCNLMWATGYI